MSEVEKSIQDFLLRWSRRKLGLEERPGEEPEAPAELNTRGEPNPKSETSSAPPDSGVELFDVARLPPIESIDSSTDIRVFLAPGVPVELTRAALRRAWRSDPAIRDFIGLAENQWDFTNPDAIPGFGSLELTQELRNLMADLLRESSAKHPDASGSGCGSPGRNATAIASPEALAPDRITTMLPQSAVAPGTETRVADAALQNNLIDDDEPTSLKPKHGGALPK